MKISVFHIFAGSERALVKKTGGVETLVNSMFHYKENGISMAIVGRSRRVLPQIIVESDQGMSNRSSEVGQSGSAQRSVFPFFPYLLSNMILGLTISWFMCAFCRGQKKQTNIVIHAHDPIIGAVVFLTPSKILGSAVYVSQFHSEYTKRLALMLPRTLMTRLTIGLYSFLEKICVLRADNVIAVNENISKYLVEIGCAPHKILRIPVFIDTYVGDIDLAGIEKARRALDINDRHLVLAYIGRISKEKNLKILIKAFLDLEMPIRKNLKLLIVGEGEQLNELKSSVHLSDEVLFLGHRTDIGQILSLSDVFVLPSLTEGFPLSLLEAMSFGKAIIASNIPAIKEILDDEKEAILFDPRSSEKLKKAVLRFYDDSSLRKKFGENAKKKASQYNIDGVYPRILQVYRESLRKNRFR